MSITVYGASDDLIEVEGDIYEEFNPRDGYPSYLAFPDGTLLKIVYDEEGMWRISPIMHGRREYAIIPATEEDGTYSDRAIINGNIKWVALATSYARK